LQVNVVSHAINNFNFRVNVKVGDYFGEGTGVRDVVGI
jgi:hypothetical protein